MATAHRPAAPTPTSVPPVDDGFWKESTWAILFALIDAAVPPVVPESALTDKRSQLRISQRQYEEAYDHVCRTTTHPPELDKFKEYLRARPADNPRFVLSIKRVFSNLPDDAKKKLGGALDLMGHAFPLAAHLTLRVWLTNGAGRGLAAGSSPDTARPFRTYRSISEKQSFGLGQRLEFLPSDESQR